MLAVSFEEGLLCDRHLITLDGHSLRELIGDFFPNIARPPLGRVEGDHSDWLGILAVEEIADHGLAVGVLLVGTLPMTAWKL
jgi:hypothetical protein